MQSKMTANIDDFLFIENSNELPSVFEIEFIAGGVCLISLPSSSDLLSLPLLPAALSRNSIHIPDRSVCRPREHRQARLRSRSSTRDVRAGKLRPGGRFMIYALDANTISFILRGEGGSSNVGGKKRAQETAL